MSHKNLGWIENWLTSGHGDTLPIGVRERVEFLNVVSTFGLMAMFAFTVNNLVVKDYQNAIATGSAFLSIIPMLFLIRRNTVFFAAGLYTTAVMGFLFLYLTFAGRESGSGAVWVIALPLLSIFLTNTVVGNLFSFLYFLLLTLYFYVPGLNYGELTLPFRSRILSGYALIWIFALSFNYFTGRAKRMAQETSVELASSAKNLEASQQALLEESEQVTSIFQNIPTGIFTLDKSFIIRPPFSKQLANILSVKDVKGKSFLSLLQTQIKDEEQYKSCQKWLELCTSGNLKLERFPELNPFRGLELRAITPENTMTVKAVNAEFKVTSVSGKDRKVLVMMTDVTQELRLQQEIEANRKQHDSDMTKLYQIIHCDTNELQQFLAYADRELEDLNDSLQFESTTPQEKIEDMYRRLHGIKGRAQLLSLNALAEAIHSAEDFLSGYRGRRVSGKVVRAIVAQFAVLKREIAEVRRLFRDALDFVKRSQRPSVDQGLVASLRDYLKREGQQSGREYVLESGNFDATLLTDKHKEFLSTCFSQFLRNSLAHGFESMEERQAKGKPLAGLVQITTELLPQEIRVTYRDDGRGLDLGAIHARAMRIPELVERATAIQNDKAKTAMMIFSPHFSMKQESGLDAGRGVGLSLVYDQLKALGGKLSLQQKKGAYLEFHLVFPLTTHKDAP